MLEADPYVTLTNAAGNVFVPQPARAILMGANLKYYLITTGHLSGRISAGF